MGSCFCSELRPLSEADAGNLTAHTPTKPLGGSGAEKPQEPIPGGRDTQSGVHSDLPESGLDSQAPQMLLEAAEESILGFLGHVEARGHQVLSLRHHRYCLVSLKS